MSNDRVLDYLEMVSFNAANNFLNFLLHGIIELEISNLF